MAFNAVNCSNKNETDSTMNLLMAHENEDYVAVLMQLLKCF